MSTDIIPASKSAGSRPIWNSPVYRSYFLGLLICTYVANHLDRQLLSILVEPIKRDLQLADWQIGALGGIAFAAFYVSMGVPAAVLSDRLNRVNIIAGALSFWSVATAACGLTTNFLQLFLARIGVAAGEAAGTPPSFSLISDLFPPKARATAMGIYTAAPSIGTALGLVAGGWLSVEYGWRATFMMVGIPGLLLALVFRLTLREPPRGHSENRGDVGKGPPFLAVARLLFSRRAFVTLAVASGLASFCSFAMTLWLPSFYIRSYQLSTVETGLWLGFLNIAFGAVGSILGGILADRLAVRDRRWLMFVPMASTLLCAPLVFIGFTTSYLPLSLACTGGIIALNHAWAGPVHATVQGLVGLRMRAVAVALLLFVINLIGLGFGPPIIGLISDTLRQEFGAHSLRIALFLTTPVLLISSSLYFLASKFVRADLDGAPA